MSESIRYNCFYNYKVFVISETACYDGLNNYELTG
jgi:hypothetical protein